MKSDKTISQQMKELEQKLDWFNGDEFTLDEAAEHYDEVEKLAADVEKRLLEMQNTVEVIKKKFD
jgi:exonuclease VII small subunit